MSFEHADKRVRFYSCKKARMHRCYAFLTSSSINLQIMDFLILTILVIKFVSILLCHAIKFLKIQELSIVFDCEKFWQTLDTNKQTSRYSRIT